MRGLVLIVGVLGCGSASNELCHLSLSKPEALDVVVYREQDLNNSSCIAGDFGGQLFNVEVWPFEQPDDQAQRVFGITTRYGSQGETINIGERDDEAGFLYRDETIQCESWAGVVTWDSVAPARLSVFASCNDVIVVGKVVASP